VKVPKPTVIKDAKYLAWLRTQACYFLRYGFTECHDFLGSGIEVSHLDGKSRDDRCLPSCPGHHRTNRVSWHSGQKSFCAYYGVTKEQLIAEAERLYAIYKEGL